MSTLHPSPAGAASQPIAAHGTPTAIVEAYAKAYARATDARMIAYKNADGSYSVPSSSEAGVEYSLAKTGRRWYDWSCSCKGGNHVACMHRAVVVHCEKYHVHAVRPSSADASTPEDVALSEQIKREVLSEMLQRASAQAFAVSSVLDRTADVLAASCKHQYNDSNSPDFTCVKCGHVYSYEAQAARTERVAGYRAQLAAGESIWA